MNKARGYGLSAELERKVRKDQNTCKNFTELKLWMYKERNASLQARMADQSCPHCRSCPQLFRLIFCGEVIHIRGMSASVFLFFFSQNVLSRAEIMFDLKV